MLDLIIRGGTLVDGTGAAPVTGDVGIKDGRIAEVGGRIASPAREAIDADGALVTPGFVDIHTHYDGQAIWSERLSPSSGHGVTTVVGGNCGVGFAPCRPADRALLVSVMEGVEDIPGVVMADGLSWDWESYPDYLDAVDRRRHDIDIGLMLPHVPLRLFVMGERAANREPATQDDLAAMYALARQGVEAGAIGIATSLLFTHRTRDGDTIPTFGVAETELEVIARAMGDAGGGIWQGVFSGLPERPIGDDLDMLARLTRIGKCTASFSLGQLPPDPNAWRDTMREVARVNGAGTAIKAQVYPRGHGVLVNLDLSVHAFCLCPSFIEIAALPLAEKVRRMRDPELRARLLREEPANPTSPFSVMGRQFARMFPLGERPDYEPAGETSVAVQAQRQGRDPLDVVYDMLLEHEGANFLFLPFANYVEESLDFFVDMIRDPNTVIGLGDGGAHYGMICDSTFTTFMLSHWTRDRAGTRLSIGEVVAALSRKPALAAGMRDRGVIAPGFKADLNVIDYDRLGLALPHVAYDLPAGGKRVTQDAAGYVATLVSGELIRRDDAATEALPGRLVRRGRQAVPAG
jgi:N-acyl-D-aspartate/D-glutamate deacylase